MKVFEVIERVDRIKPNAFELEDKLRWLNEAEGLVQTQVFLLAPEEIVTYGAEDTDAELLVSPPHDKLYERYLIAQIDFANGEYKSTPTPMPRSTARTVSLPDGSRTRTARQTLTVELT